MTTLPVLFSWIQQPQAHSTHSSSRPKCRFVGLETSLVFIDADAEVEVEAAVELWMLVRKQCLRWEKKQWRR